MIKQFFILLKALTSWQKILIAIIAGASFGLILGPEATCLKPIGILFIHAIQMMIIPVVFTAIVCAVISIDDLSLMRRLGLKAMIVYSGSMAISAIIGLTIASIIAPGTGLMLQRDTGAVSVLPTFADMLINIIPTNPVAAFANGNILQILIFALVLGVSINLAGEQAKPVTALFKSFSSVANKLVQIVMSFAPYGIFALIAWVSGEYGMAVFLPLLKFLLTVYLSCMILIVAYYGTILWFYAKLSPITFFKQTSAAILLAFSTSSSAATLPVTIECAEKNLKIPQSLAGFLLPLGTTLNLNGLSIYLSVATVFAANIYGFHLGMSDYITIVCTIILTSMGAGGIPGSAIMVMSAVMSSIGLPLGAVPLIAGVDRLNDMAQTMTNVTGDLFSTVIIAKSEESSTVAIEQTLSVTI